MIAIAHYWIREGGRLIPNTPSCSSIKMGKFDRSSDFWVTNGGNCQVINIKGPVMYSDGIGFRIVFELANILIRSYMYS